MEEDGNLNNRKEVKIINLYTKSANKNPAITSLTIYENYLVVGTSIGTV